MNSEIHPNDSPFGGIESYPSEIWAESCALTFQRAIEGRLACSNHISVMLTGGKSVKNIYKAWSKFPEFRTLNNVTFFLGDERIGLQEDYQSNFEVINQELFFNGVPRGCKFESIAPSGGAEMEAERYNALLPESIDILILSMGLDGHIASIFPGSEQVYEHTRKVVTSISPHHPKLRISITPLVIERAKLVYVLVSGNAKIQLFQRMATMKKNYSLMPAQIAKRGVWLLET